MRPSRSTEYPIVRLWKILGRQPEIDGVARDLLQGAIRHQRGQQRLLGPVHPAERLADHLDVAHRIGEAIHPEIEIVQRQRLLEHRVVRRQRQRQHGLTVVEHVVPPDLIGAVGEPVRMRVVGRAQQERGGIGGAAGDNDDIGEKGPAAFRATSATTPVIAVPAALVSSFSAQRIAQQRDVGSLQRGAHGESSRRPTLHASGRESRRRSDSGCSGYRPCPVRSSSPRTAPGTDGSQPRSDRRTALRCAARARQAAPG